MRSLQLLFNHFFKRFYAFLIIERCSNIINYVPIPQIGNFNKIFKKFCVRTIKDGPIDLLDGLFYVRFLNDIREME